MSTPYYSDELVTLYHGDCLDIMAAMPDASVDAVVTDPPYGLEFMGKKWDTPWRESDINADAAFTSTGFTDGGERLPRPTFVGSTNPKCATCKGTRRGRRDGTAKVAVCLCSNGGKFPNVRAVEMRAFGEWCATWTSECLRVLKPGGHLLAFGGTRTWHRLAVAVEESGFEIRDSIGYGSGVAAWCYGSGFPKSRNISADPSFCQRVPGVCETAAEDATQSAAEVLADERGSQAWRGWPLCGGCGKPRIPLGLGTALKPSWEPILVARKPLIGTVAANVLQYGTGALNIDATRVPGHVGAFGGGTSRSGGIMGAVTGTRPTSEPHDRGRWPANVVLDESQAAALDEQAGVSTSRVGKPRGASSGDGWGMTATGAEYTDSGGPSRFFPTFRYEAKAPTAERPRVDGVAHPTVKPLDLMRWLVRLVTPPGGTVLEPFAGSGTTAEACVHEHLRCIAIEREAEYLPLIVARLTRPMEIGFNFGDAS